MLDASSHEAIDKGLSFLDAFVDKCCDKNETGSITRVFMMNIDMVDLLYCYYLNSGWYNKKPNERSEKTQKFKLVLYKAFYAYLALKMKTWKWLAFYHVCDAIREAGDLVYLHVGLFESSHKTRKGAYCLTSKSFRCVINGIIEKHNKRNDGHPQSHLKR